MTQASLSTDDRVVMTLDAGGTNFRFSAMRGGSAVTEMIAMPAHGDDLERCLANLVNGFSAVLARCPAPPSAISFAFPGPADYAAGIIGDLGNLPAFRGGIALGPMLEEKFHLPVFLNNDGDLFTYGEAMAGLLPEINRLLDGAGSAKRFHNLFGLTLGTGLGGGIVRNGELFLGDSSGAGEIWLLRHKLAPEMNAEEGASIRAVRRAYAEGAHLSLEAAPDPREIAQIARGERPGEVAVAAEAYRRLGETVGDVLGNVLNVVDSLAVIGGGLSQAWPLFFPALLAEVNGSYTSPAGQTFRRTSRAVFNLEDPIEREKFLCGEVRSIAIPGSQRTIPYDPLARLGVGISRLGTSEAVALGAYAFALHRLDR